MELPPHRPVKTSADRSRKVTPTDLFANIHGTQIFYSFNRWEARFTNPFSGLSCIFLVGVMKGAAKLVSLTFDQLFTVLCAIFSDRENTSLYQLIALGEVSLSVKM